MTEQSDTRPSDRTGRPTVRMLPSRHKRAAQGHPWIYSNEIHMDQETRAIPPGSLVRVVTEGGAALGAATFNPRTLIACRLVATGPDTAIDRRFLAGRLRRALTLRERLFERPYYRLIHAEADGLPALIVDRFGGTVVVQANSAGMDRLEPELLAALDEVLAPDCVLMRNDSSARALEGLAQETRVAKGSLDGPLRVEENGAVFFGDPAGGQKTGWFFDQRENRAFMAGLAQGARVLDAYCYNGGFGVLAAARGAAEVVLVDRSEGALANAGRAAEANGVAGRCEFRRAEVFAELERLGAAGERFDVVIADPPAFVKSRKDVQVGARGYRKLARLSAALVAPGGFLFIASCSHNMETALFAEQIAAGLRDTGRTGRILRSAGAAPDHPVHPLLPESAYLKAQVLQLD
ncbi:class I SAM-dependent rRNA methyltransferase [Arenibaculum pallidiluteum]|uniref:class I SAM-dependent rRNA methyltransferase n=1 Tax=Arenibaculum pallidiluteum TaxID=2812559 RepID=UPI001A965034|nr:class I SAM-dependent rRNA methyltransferase [Arenibaculum pallidiluteum]